MAEQETQKALKMVDIVDFSMQDKPIKVADAFNTLIADKVTNSIDARKQEVSAKMFADKVEEVIPILSHLNLTDVLYTQELAKISYMTYHYMIHLHY